MISAVRPFLMFEGRAEEAIGFYLSVLPGAKAGDIHRYPPAMGDHAGEVAMASFEVGGQTVLCNDSTIRHNFGFTPASSLFVDVEEEAEVDRLVAALGEEGEVLMPVAFYGFSRRFGWVNDRFGVSWQVNCP